MLETPQIVEAAAPLIAFIHITVPREEIRTVMGPGLTELRAEVAAQGAAVTGPWFTHHLRRPAETFDFEICLPVAAKITPAGRVEAGQGPGGKVARAVYGGNYDGLGAAWGEFDAWLQANGYQCGPDLWECYLAGPEASPEPAAWRTELTRRLISNGA